MGALTFASVALIDLVQRRAAGLATVLRLSSASRLAFSVTRRSAMRAQTFCASSRVTPSKEMAKVSWERDLKSVFFFI